MFNRHNRAHTFYYLYIVVIWSTVSTRYRKYRTMSKNRAFFCTFFALAKKVHFFIFKKKGIYTLKELVERIKKDGNALGKGVLKVDSFVTHQVDPQLMAQIGETFAKAFAKDNITKIVTIEASGIAPALYTAHVLDAPMIFARKAKSLTMNEELLTTSVYSFTKETTNQISISKKFLSEKDRVLIIDDFLANGQAAKGLIELCRQAGAQVEGVGIVIEKSFQPGRELLEEMGVKVVSLARIAALNENTIEFLQEDA